MQQLAHLKGQTNLSRRLMKETKFECRFKVKIYDKLFRRIRPLLPLGSDGLHPQVKRRLGERNGGPVLLRFISLPIVPPSERQENIPVMCFRPSLWSSSNLGVVSLYPQTGKMVDNPTYSKEIC